MNRPDPHALPEALVGAQRWEAALDATGAALGADPTDPRLLALLVRCLRALGRRQEAVDAAQRLLAVTPEDPYALRLGTLVLLDVGWVDEAIGLATRAVGHSPNTAANHLALSRAWAASKRPEAAAQQLEAAREAVLLDPNSVDAQLQIGTALAALGDPAAARAAYREALRLDPGSSAACNNLAVLDLHAGAHRDAAAHLAAALAVDPQDRTARHNLDALAIAALRRLGWWSVLAPIPALAAAALGWQSAAVVLAVVALLAPVVAPLPWWRGLTAGQRQHLRGLPRRVEFLHWVWPGSAAVVAWTCLAVGVLGADAWPAGAVLGIAALLVLAVVRLLVVSARRTWRVELAARRSRLMERRRTR